MNLALFDLDGTLLPIDSDHAFGEHLVREGWADGEDFRRRNDAFYADYRAGCLDIRAYIRFITEPLRARSDTEIAGALERFVEQVARPAIRPAARALVERHRTAGDRIAIVTATHEVVTRPIARLFGVEDLIATELERDPRGRITGEIREVPAFREGKVARVTQWLAAGGHSWASFGCTVAYSDSTNDLALLEAAMQPVATNPSPELERLARERGWPVLRLFDEGISHR
jgi:HAD superfamily hydrolase (TIGR01490 family)